MPTVVFVDHSRWGTFAQLAAVVRRAGGRTVRVTTQRSTWYNRLVDWVLFNRSIYLDDASALARVGELLTGEHVVDLQCTEYVCGPLAQGDAARLPAGVGRSLAIRGVLLDKFTVGELGRERGIRTPAKLAADRVTVDEAIAAFGLPLVVKARVGASGDLVRIARSVADAQRALAELSVDLTELFFEQMVVGDDIDYSAIVDTDGGVHDIVTRTVVAAPGSTTPPCKIQVVDEPDLLAFGRLAIEKLGFTGIAHMDTVRDANGQHWLIDLNLRAWGSMISCRGAGADFTAAYLYSVGLRDTPPVALAARPGATVTVFPGVVDEQIRLRRVLGGAAAFVRHSWPYLAWLGPRYWLGQAMAMALGMAGSVQSGRTRTGESSPELARSAT